jgi:hypothetical protein
MEDYQTAGGFWVINSKSCWALQGGILQTKLRVNFKINKSFKNKTLASAGNMMALPPKLP